MDNPQNYTDRALLGGFKITLQSNQMNQAKFKKNIKPNFLKFVIEVPYCNEFLKEVATIYIRLKYLYKNKYQAVLSARFDKQDKALQVLVET